MTITLYLIFACLGHAILSLQHPFSTSSLTVTLHSKDNQKNVPFKFDCSCQLVVFSVYNDHYTLTVATKDTKQSHARLKIRSSGDCMTSPIDSNKALFQIQNTQYKGSQITESYFIQLFTPSNLTEPYFNTNQLLFYNGDKCDNIEQNGEQRIVYLVNKTKQQSQGEYQYVINLPTNSIAITQVLSLVLLFLLSHNIKYRRFKPFVFNLIFAIMYVVFLLVTVYIQSLFQDNYQVFFWVIMGFSMFCMTFYFIDITSIFLHKSIVIIVSSVLLSLLVGVIDVLIFTDAWFMNDLIGVLVVGALIKFVVIKKLKAAVWPLLILWLFFVFRQFVIVFHLQNFQQALQIKIIPLFIQLPAMFGDDDTGFICSAFGTSKIITMGLFMNYCVRVDLFLSTRFYTILCGIIAIVCMVVEYLILLFADELPVLQYSSVIIFLPVSFVVILMFSSKRGEWAELWHGSFHDIAVDRKSIRRESTILDVDELDRNLDQLKMNPSLLTST